MAAFFPLLLDASIKSVLVLAAALFFCRAARRRSAALRHLVGTLALTGVVALPLLTAVLPAWRVDLPRATGSSSAGALVPERGPSEPKAPSVENAGASGQATRGDLEPEPVPRSARRHPQAGDRSLRAAAPSAPLDWRGWVVTFYLLGAAAALVRLLAGRFAVHRLIRSAIPIADGPWREALAQVKTGGARVRLLESADLPVPATAGVFRPVVLVPAGALGDLATWRSGDLQEADAFNRHIARSPDRRMILVLQHEIAHIRRRDGLWQLIAQLACAAYWFNPLVWLLNGHVSLDRERACDDAVLTHDRETNPADYAQILLDLARHLQRTFIPQGVVPMARHPHLESRVRSVLDTSHPRRSLNRWAAIGAAAVIAGLVAPLSVLSADGEPSTPEASPYMLTLPTGTQVELIGVSRFPSKGQSWWRPDGTPLEERPYEQFRGGISSWGDPYEFAIRLLGEPLRDAAFSWSVVDNRGMAGGSINGVDAQATYLPSGSQTATVRIGLASGPWTTAEEASARGEARSILFKGVVFSRAIESDGGVLVSASYSSGITEGRNVRMVLVDQQGQEHPMQTVSTSGAAGFKQYVARLDGIRPQEVKGFRLQTREYARYEFRNVSLRPGVGTDVQIIGPDGEVLSKGNGPQVEP